MLHIQKLSSFLLYCPGAGKLGVGVHGRKVCSVLKITLHLLPKMQGGKFIFFEALLCARSYAGHFIRTVSINPSDALLGLTCLLFSTVLITD